MSESNTVVPALHIAANGCGVGVGAFTNASSADKRFDCAFPAYFENGHEEYSESETIAGRWMGKTLYRKVLTEYDPKGGVGEIPLSGSTVTVTRMEGMCVRSDSAIAFGMRNPRNYDDQMSAYVAKASSGSGLSVYYRGVVNYTSVWFIVEYIKE